MALMVRFSEKEEKDAAEETAARLAAEGESVLTGAG